MNMNEQNEKAKIIFDIHIFLDEIAEFHLIEWKGF